MLAAVAVALLANRADGQTNRTMSDMPMADSGNSTDVRLRIAWGGGTAKRWVGRIALDQGRLSDPILLGVEPNEPGSMAITSREIRFNSPSSRAYDGVDVRIKCRADAQLRVEIRPLNDPRRAKTVNVKIKDLLLRHQSEALDRQDNRLLIRRSPGDTIRAKFERDNLVFAPRERFEIEFIPQHLQAGNNSNYRAAVELYDAAGSRQWRKTQELRTDDRGRMPKIKQLDFAVPQREGVYELVASITPRRIGDNLLAPAAKWKRRIQFIVLEKQAAAVGSTNWKPVGVIDPDSSAWWKTWQQIRRFNLLPNYSNGPIQHGKIANRRVEGKPWIELSSDSWRAYPLPISSIGKPHVLEVEYCRASEQQLLISLLEPNAAGRVVPLTIDSGVEVGASERSDKKSGFHRLVFWPKTKSPLLLLANRSKGIALFGKIRVLAGPNRLPPLTDVEHRRTTAVYYQKPYFAENFGAGERRDESTGRSLPDWSTFYNGADRLIQYLKYTGHNSAIITVAADGSAIYPSSLLQPTPKFDAGIFFETGQDPIRKDVLEMLFRMFDRAGLKLIPAVQFATPLPVLEDQLRRSRSSSEGVSLVYRDGQSWRERFGTDHESAIYNPLNDRVQRATRDVLRELVRRYGKHKSFGGIHVPLSARGFAQLPSEHWGCDDKTMLDFATQVGFAKRITKDMVFRNKKLMATWLNWRARRMAKLYTDWAKTTAIAPGVKLLLGSPDLWDQGRVQDLLRPSLPASRGVVDAMLRCGLDANLIDDSTTVLCRPYAILQNQPLHEQTMQVMLNNSADMDAYFGGPGSRARRVTAGLFIQSFQRLPLPSFDAVSPFGSDKTQVLLFPHVSSSGKSSRQHFIHALAALDSQMWLNGGWVLPLGQEEAMRPVMEVFRRLPVGRFKEVITKPKSSGNESKQPVVFRTRSENGKTWFYLVNDSPWPVSVAVQFATRGALQTVGPRRLPLPVPKNQSLSWTISLEPYDLVAATINQANVPVTRWQVELPKRVSGRLQQRIAAVNARFGFLKNPVPLRVLRNPGFELRGGRGVPGWDQIPQRPGVVIRLEKKAEQTPSHNGEHSLYLKSNGPVAWVRSHEFVAPRTGRLFMLVWLRTSDPDKQPPLRLSVEAAVRGDPRKFYRFASVGRGTRFPLKNAWGKTPYLFPMDRLPLKGVDKIQVGFDLMGRGEVWIDDVALFDLYFLPRELSELRQKYVGLAKYNLKKENFRECERILNGYWPRFLLENAGRTRRQPNGPRGRVAERPDRAKPNQQKKKKWFPFPFF